MTAYEILNRGFSLCGENFRGFGEKETALVWLNEAIGECLCPGKYDKGKNRKSTCRKYRSKQPYRHR